MNVDEPRNRGTTNAVEGSTENGVDFAQANILEEASELAAVKALADIAFSQFVLYFLR